MRKTPLDGALAALEAEIKARRKELWIMERKAALLRAARDVFGGIVMVFSAGARDTDDVVKEAERIANGKSEP